MRLLRENKILREYKSIVLENLKQAKSYVVAGKLSKEDLTSLVNSDPTPQKKYVGWMAKVWIDEKPSIEDLSTTIEQFNRFVESDKIKTKDINQFKSYENLKNEIDRINKSGEGLSRKDLEDDYETIVNTPDLLIMVPHTHEASRKLGLTTFKFRYCKDKEGKFTGKQDSHWCTTYAAPDHFNDYYYNQNVTLYYIKVKSEKMQQELIKAFPEIVEVETPSGDKQVPRGAVMQIVALAVLGDGRVDGYDSLDGQLSQEAIDEFKNIIGIS
jgi:hypothetical protein